MRKTLILCSLLIICTLTACGNKNTEQEVPITETTTIAEKKPYLYSQDIISRQITSNYTVDPFIDDILLDKYNNNFYYFNTIIGLYKTDLTGSYKELLPSFENDKVVVFSTPNRINAISKSGKFSQNIIMRKEDDNIDILFITNDWVYYSTTSITGEIKYFKINLSGTCKELKQNPLFDLNIENKIEKSYYFPPLLDYTTNRDNTYRSKKNKFTLTFPKIWANNYTIYEKEGLLIVYYKPRLDKTIQYEFFRIVKKDTINTNNLTPIKDANDMLLLPSGTFKIGKYESGFTYDSQTLDGQLIEQMLVDLPTIINTIHN